MLLHELSLAVIRNMRIFMLLLLSMALSYCQTKTVNEKHTFQLQNKLGDCWAELECFLPFEFDTIYFDTTSKTNCGLLAYQVYSKKYALKYRDSKFGQTMEVPQIDSTYSFSIVYSPFGYCDSLRIRQKYDFKMFEYYLKSKFEPEIPELVVDSTFKANEQTYTVLSYKDKIGQTTFYKVDAYTIIKNRLLSISIENNILSQIEFNHQANKILKSIRIKLVKE